LFSGAAAEAALQGTPSVAFSGDSNDHVSYTTLETNPNGAASVAARVYTSLSLKFIEVLLGSGTSILPPNTSLNINYPSISKCREGDIKFIFTKLYENHFAKDIHICGSERLPDESSTFKKGCFATVSVFDARNKGDVSADIQKEVYDRIKPILSCLP
jgi:5'-nucleotidase